MGASRRPGEDGPFIEAEKQEGHSVARCCELFEVFRAAYCERRNGEPCARELSDAELITRIREIHDESDGSYGSPRVTKELNKRGRPVGRRRVGRLMRLAGLEGRAKKVLAHDHDPGPGVRVGEGSDPA